jgi:hypothetical protein
MAYSKAMGLALLGLVIVPGLAEAACNPTAECSRCLAYAPRIFNSGGQCIQHYNDPACEATKAACQVCMAGPGLVNPNLCP